MILSDVWDILGEGERGYTTYHMIPSSGRYETPRSKKRKDNTRLKARIESRLPWYLDSRSMAPLRGPRIHCHTRRGFAFVINQSLSRLMDQLLSRIVRFRSFSWWLY